MSGTRPRGGPVDAFVGPQQLHFIIQAGGDITFQFAPLVEIKTRSDPGLVEHDRDSVLFQFEQGQILVVQKEGGCLGSGLADPDLFTAGTVDQVIDPFAAQGIGEGVAQEFAVAEKDQEEGVDIQEFVQAGDGIGFKDEVIAFTEVDLKSPVDEPGRKVEGLIGRGCLFFFLGAKVGQEARQCEHPNKNFLHGLLILRGDVDFYTSVRIGRMIGIFIGQRPIFRR